MTAKSNANKKPQQQVYYRGRFPSISAAHDDSLNSLAASETEAASVAAAVTAAANAIAASAVGDALSGGGPFGGCASSDLPPTQSPSSLSLPQSPRPQLSSPRPLLMSSSPQLLPSGSKQLVGPDGRHLENKSCSTELDDESLSPDDENNKQQQQTQQQQQQHHQLLTPNQSVASRHAAYQIDDEIDEEIIVSQFNERTWLMSSSSDEDRRRRRKNSGEDVPTSTIAASGSIVLPSTTMPTSAAATNRNFLNDEEEDGYVFRNGERNVSSAIDSGYGNAALITCPDPSYAVRTSSAMLESDSGQTDRPSVQLPQRPRMGRRFTLNPLIFAKEERDARRQSLAQLKLSYYPTNAHPDVYDAGLGICSWSLLCLSWIIVLLTFPISICFCLKVVQEYERAVIFRLGRLIGGGARGPGIFFVMPCVEHYTKVDLRTVSFSVPPQEILTRDSVTVSVDAVVYYRVSNATVSVANVENAHHSTRLLAQTTLRNMLGMQNLSEILSSRDNLANLMQSLLDDATESWGIKVERVEIKDVRLPIQLQRAMAAEAEATREARAKVIAAEGEQKASRSLREAARVIAMSPAAIQLRYLQTLNSVAAEKNSTIIFPLPMELIRQFICCDTPLSKISR